MTNFWRALSQAGPAAVDSFHAAEMQRAQRREQMVKEAAAKIYGSTVQNMFALPPPGMPQGFNTPNRMPGGMPTPPMGPPSRQSPFGPSPPPQAAPTPQPTPGGVQSMPMPPRAPQPQPQAAPPKMDWQTILTSIARENPGADPEAIAGAVDKLQPLMHEQAQAEWRQLQLNMSKERLDVQKGNIEADNARADEAQALNNKKFEYRMQERNRRLDQLQQALDTKVTAAKLDPAKKAKVDMLRNAYTQAQSTYRTAQIGASYARWKGVAARKAEEALRKAESAYSAYADYVETLGIPVDEPDDVPDAPAPQPNAQPAPEEVPTIAPPKPAEKRSDTTVPATVGITGTEPPPAPLPTKIPGKNGEPALPPLPKHMSMMRLNQVYPSPKGYVKYTGKGDKPFALVQWDAKTKTWVPK